MSEITLSIYVWYAMENYIKEDFFFCKLTDG